MKANHLILFIVTVLGAGNAHVYAETKYISNTLHVGLHEGKSVDSPIIKTVPSNTALEVIKKDELMSYVTEPGGASGWLDNSYLVSQPGADTARHAEINPLKEQLDQAKTTINELQKKLAAKPVASHGAGAEQLATENNQLKEEYKQEKMRAGKLTVELAELRKRIGQNNDNASLYQELGRLEQTNKTLEIELAKALEITLADGSRLAELNARQSSMSMRNILLYLLFAVITGITFGLYIMDFLTRRRHGGFRV